MMGKSLPPAPEFPQSMMYIYNLFISVKSSTRDTITAQSILNYCQLFRTSINAFEADAIMELDNAYKKEVLNG